MFSRQSSTHDRMLEERNASQGRESVGSLRSENGRRQCHESVERKVEKISTRIGTSRGRLTNTQNGNEKGGKRATVAPCKQRRGY